ncbi:unnamed protein product [Caenorhabditis auriculariae]|uniref:Reverse transcriptase domain-containing protein n=1 Tax=Caenorhabditis auriculariae TaxID=2777116 RepID=A0A8S1H866_9PELO|nr:unnamed protein product [Caenorhabditis auriculariae]
MQRAGSSNSPDPHKLPLANCLKGLYSRRTWFELMRLYHLPFLNCNKSENTNFDATQVVELMLGRSLKDKLENTPVWNAWRVIVPSEKDMKSLSACEVKGEILRKYSKVLLMAAGFQEIIGLNNCLIIANWFAALETLQTKKIPLPNLKILDAPIGRMFRSKAMRTWISNDLERNRRTASCINSTTVFPVSFFWKLPFEKFRQEALADFRRRYKAIRVDKESLPPRNNGIPVAKLRLFCSNGDFRPIYSNPKRSNWKLSNTLQDLNAALDYFSEAAGFSRVRSSYFGVKGLRDFAHYQRKYHSDKKLYVMTADITKCFSAILATRMKKVLRLIFVDRPAVRATGWAHRRCGAGERKFRKVTVAATAAEAREKLVNVVCRGYDVKDIRTESSLLLRATVDQFSPRTLRKSSRQRARGRPTDLFFSQGRYSTIFFAHVSSPVTIFFAKNHFLLVATIRASRIFNLSWSQLFDLLSIRVTPSILLIIFLCAVANMFISVFLRVQTSDPYKSAVASWFAISSNFFELEANKTMSSANRSRVFVCKPWTSLTPYCSTMVKTLLVGTLNVRLLLTNERLAALENAIREVNFDIIGLCEVRRAGTGSLVLNDTKHTLYYHGTASQAGVGFLVHKSLAANVDFTPVSDRLAYLDLKLKKKRVGVIQVYAPTTSYADEVFSSCLEDLEQALSRIQRRDRHPGADSSYSLTLGDFNAKVGSKTSTESSLGSHGIGVRNDRGNTLVDFCEANGLRIWNTYFKKRGTKKWTWKSPDGVTKNCIDYVIADRRCPIYDVDVIANLHFDTDHRLVRAKMKIVSRHVNKRATSKRVFDKPLFSYAVERLFNQNSPETYECLKKVFSEASTIATTYTIVVGRQNGLTMMTLAGMFGVTEAGISQFLKRQKAQDGSTNSQRTGRPRTSRTNPRLTAPAIRREVFLNSPSPPSVSTVKRRLNAAGIMGRRPVKKPLISEKNRAARVKWAKEHLNRTRQDWNKILWSDETVLHHVSQSTNPLNFVTPEEEELVFVGPQNLVPALTRPVEMLLRPLHPGGSILFRNQRRLFTVETDGGDSEFKKTSRLIAGAVSLGLVLDVLKMILSSLRGLMERSPLQKKMLQRRSKHSTTLCMLHNKALRQSSRHPKMTFRLFCRARFVLLCAKQNEGKAPGPDFITLEMLLAAEENAVPILASIYNECLKNERTPTSMSDSIVRLLHKKGSCLDIGNYRPVALMSTIHKIFTSILRRRAERSLEEAQPIEQTGFRPGYSTSENTLVVSEMIQKSHEYRFPLFLMFIDYKKAFDSVEFGSLWTALSEFGVHSKIVNTLKNIYDEAKVSVRIRGHDIPVQIGRGVRQGDTISPNLFNATLEQNGSARRGFIWKISDAYARDFTFRSIKAKFAGSLMEFRRDSPCRLALAHLYIRVFEQKYWKNYLSRTDVYMFRYIDDFILCSPHKEILIEMTQTLFDGDNNFGLSASLKKTQVNFPYENFKHNEKWINWCGWRISADCREYYRKVKVHNKMIWKAQRLEIEKEKKNNKRKKYAEVITLD